MCVWVFVQGSKASIVGDELLADMLQQMEVGFITARVVSMVIAIDL